MHNVIVLGEREHESPDFPVSQWGTKMILERPAFSIKQRERMLRILPSLPVKWCNLLPPNASCGIWNVNYATVLAMKLRDHLVRYHAGVLLACAGSRVAYAIHKALRGGVKYPRTWGEVVDTGLGFNYTRLPHPSGRCRVWNDETIISRIREALQAGCPVG